MFKKLTWLLGFRQDKDEEELEQFERKLIEMLRKGEISFPSGKEEVLERCMRRLKRKGVLKSV